MKEFLGSCISEGFALGRLLVIRKEELSSEDMEEISADLELERFEAAREAAVRRYRFLQLRPFDRNAFGIFRGYRLILQDPLFTEEVRRIISKGGIRAETAVKLTAEHFVQGIFSSEPQKKATRKADLEDVAAALFPSLSDSSALLTADEPFILAAESLTPSDLFSLDRSLLLGVVTMHTAANSHFAILTRSMGIPVVTGINTSLLSESAEAALFAEEGRLLLDPTPEIRQELRSSQHKEKELQEAQNAYIGKRAVRPDGRELPVMASISSPSDLPSVLMHDAEGIGLFRSEYLFLSEELPSEETQFQLYASLLEGMDHKRVIIRTMDLGSDKEAPALSFPRENNPALGLRGIRYALSHKELFRLQLRALLRASVFGSLSILYPMITDTGELLQVKEYLKEILDELKKEKLPVGSFSQGVMIETPSAALLSDELAKECDFFSIGTNDLMQYTMALDRTNLELSSLYPALPEALLRLIRICTENAGKQGIPVFLCGEAGSDPENIPSLLQSGIDGFSVTPGMVLPIRKAVLNHLHQNG